MLASVGACAACARLDPEHERVEGKVAKVFIAPLCNRHFSVPAFAGQNVVYVAADD
jgi:hypothetical protein